MGTLKQKMERLLKVFQMNLDRLVKIVNEKIKAGTGKFLFPKYSKRKFERTSRRKTETKRCFG